MRTFSAAAIAVLTMSPAAGFVVPVPSAKPILSRVSSRSYSATPLRMAEKVDAEVVSKGGSKSTSAVKTDELIDSAKEVFASMQSAVKGFDVGSVQDDAKALVEGIKTNTQAGTTGQRGEEWTAGQVAILFFVLIGSLPILGWPLELLAGPGLLLGGAGLTAISALQLGKSFSFWAEPAEGGVLNTTGAYSLCRHPLYLGLMSFSLGLGFTTDSFTRIALACLLAYVLDRKATLEEDKLVKVHPAYKTYKEEVSKFFPKIY